MFWQTLRSVVRLSPFWQTRVKFCSRLRNCFKSFCWRFGLCHHKLPALVIAPTWLEKMRMISHAGLLSRPRQSEWICNRVTLTQHQSPVTQNSYLESRSPKELEVQDRFVRTAMTRKSRWKWHQRICLKRQSQGKISDLARTRTYCFKSSCLRFGLCSHKWPAPAFAPAWLEKMPNDFSGRSAAKAESKWVDLE